MTETTHIRVYESDKERIDTLADDDRSWPGKVQQLLSEAEAAQEDMV
jgi:hypothetical protein